MNPCNQLLVVGDDNLSRQVKHARIENAQQEVVRLIAKYCRGNHAAATNTPDRR